MQSFHYWPLLLVKYPTVSSGTVNKGHCHGGGWVGDGLRIACCLFHIAQDQPGAQPVCSSPFVLVISCLTLRIFLFPIYLIHRDGHHQSCTPILLFPLTPGSEYLASPFFLFLWLNLTLDSFICRLLLSLQFLKPEWPWPHVRRTEQEASSPHVEKPFCTPLGFNTYHSDWSCFVPLGNPGLQGWGQERTRKPSTQSVCERWVCAPSPACVSLLLHVECEVEWELGFI